MSINREMDKEDVAYIYTVEYYLAIKGMKYCHFQQQLMDLENIILSEVRKRQILYDTYM